MTSLLGTLRGPPVPEWGACTLPEALVQVRGGEGGATALGHARVADGSPPRLAQHELHSKYERLLPADPDQQPE